MWCKDVNRDSGRTAARKGTLKAVAADRMGRLDIERTVLYGTMPCVLHHPRPSSGDPALAVARVLRRELHTTVPFTVSD